ncbi:hypothetical protein FisN_24Lh099 [Fistulifera solaris]|uniref:Uncharacterized protein n=1 Tax=Fistulifera solaris TaxID=1519565 RepID=A0A1Z5K9A9_FISSO|nr:hypothetical protein FisN_24Lh099 [Fistulifera solaris]|eukprot:GAX22817.1 hypothetical protein FisN_24Lh099 [Fistulifera solaris]
MASSRWKRFAFFERNQLNMNAEVLEDLLPSISNVSGQKNPSSETDSGNDLVSLVATTASLTIDSKPPPRENTQESTDENAMAAMWASLTVCTSPEPPKDDEQETKSFTISRQNEAISDYGTRSKSFLDGLVLAFVTSAHTDLIHCIDITMRCNPPLASEMDVDSFDGWRGYFSPFLRTPPGPSRPPTLESYHLEEVPTENIVAISCCRGTSGHNPVMLACISKSNVTLWEDPHLHLSCRLPVKTPQPPIEPKVYSLQKEWNNVDGDCLSLDVIPSLLAVGTTGGAVIVYVIKPTGRLIRSYLRIPAPPAGDSAAIAVKLYAEGEQKACVFVAYRRNTDASSQASSGVCCYEFPFPNSSSSAMLSAPSARHDLDGRSVGSGSHTDSIISASGLQFMVARLDGLYSYSKTERIGVAPIDGLKQSLCLIPPAASAGREDSDRVGNGYALVSSTDSKSNRDSVDIYDADNKLVAFHLLLPPGHSVLRSAGITTKPTMSSDGTHRSGRSSAVVFTSGGSLVTFREKTTAEKIYLLVQKNLYSAAIVVAYADPSYEADNITNLYRQYAEHLYGKGDFGGAIDQYIHTIGSLETSHVLYRFLDAPKIAYVVRYLEQVRSRGLATPVHVELLRTCYLKLNDQAAADALGSTGSRLIDKSSLASIIAKIGTNPKEAIANVCSLEASQAAEILVIHGLSLARVLPRETAGVVISLCVGTYSPKSLANAALLESIDLKKMIDRKVDEAEQISKPYPIHLFAQAFIENPKILRLILAHCNRNKCPLTPSLRRTLLELSLAEWNQAKRSGDTEAEKLRHRDAIAALTDSHCRDIGDYDALVIVQQAGFEEGELLLYERLQMTPMLLERYANEGSEKSRRQMIAMCKADPEILADVLGHLVSMATQRFTSHPSGFHKDDGFEDEIMHDIMDDIEETLALARRQRVLPPVRITRILAGESSCQFSTQDKTRTTTKMSIPLSVALDYVGNILDESRREIQRLTSEVEEYNVLCNSMEQEIESLASDMRSPIDDGKHSPRMNIEDLYARVRADESETGKQSSTKPTEAFWREINQSEDSFDVIARYFGKGIIQ